MIGFTETDAHSRNDNGTTYVQPKRFRDGNDYFTG